MSTDCIAVLEGLVDTYDPDTEGPFSACHPRTGAASMKRQLDNILKALKTTKFDIDTTTIGNAPLFLFSCKAGFSTKLSDSPILVDGSKQLRLVGNRALYPHPEGRGYKAHLIIDSNRCRTPG